MVDFVYFLNSALIGMCVCWKVPKQCDVDQSAEVQVYNIFRIMYFFISNCNTFHIIIFDTDPSDAARPVRSTGPALISGSVPRRAIYLCLVEALCHFLACPSDSCVVSKLWVCRLPQPIQHLNLPVYRKIL